MFITLFRAAGATGRVFLLRNGVPNDAGLAFSGFVGPFTTIAVVPTTPQTVDFAVDALTSDQQDIEIGGNIVVRFNPVAAVKALDFTVDRRTGAHTAAWDQTLRTRIIEQVVRVVLAESAKLPINEMITAQKRIEDRLTDALKDAFTDDGFTVVSCSVPRIEATDENVAEAIGSKDREAMLAAADAATHDRRMKAVANDRAVKTYEKDTEVEVERRRAELVAAQTKNTIALAEADAKAAEIRLEPLSKQPQGVVLAAALMKAAEGGRLGTINLTTELLAAVSAAKA
jgi:hypothetical protein